MEKKPVERSVEPDPDERDEHAYEDMWYRALKAKSDRRNEDRPPADHEDPQPPAGD